MEGELVCGRCLIIECGGRVVGQIRYGGDIGQVRVAMAVGEGKVAKLRRIHHGARRGRGGGRVLESVGEVMRML